MRHLLLLLVFGIIVLLTCCGVKASNSSIGTEIKDRDKRPNIVIVMTDDQGYGEFSYNGNPIINTPNVDKFAKEGIRFTDFHVAPMCTPTRAQLLTGLDAFRTGAINVSSGRCLLNPQLKTFGDIFHIAGYQTGIFGKWHLGDSYPYRPEDRGFEEAIWFPSSHINSVPDFWDNDYFDDIYIHNGKREKYEGYCTDVFFTEAMNWIEQVSKTENPFFAYIPLNAAHWPHFVPEKYRESVNKLLEKHDDILEHMNDSQKAELISFLGMGLNIDENFGKLYHFLEESDLLENTIILFLTDNGSTFGQNYFNAGMKGTKTQLWEGGHRVPLIIKCPSNTGVEPTIISELCQVQDLLPTLADMAGIEDIPNNLDGVSLFPLIKGQTDKLKERMLVINYSRMPHFKVNYTSGNPAIPQKDGAAVLWKGWRFLENRELYNVITDPHQDNDVALQYPDIVKMMREHLDNWWNEVKHEAHQIQRVVIGNDAENPVLLTACDWLDVFVDQQMQVRRGIGENGVWNVFVDQSGHYEFELRRWPRESGVSLSDSIPARKVTDGRFVKGIPLPIHAAKIRIGEQQKSKDVEENDKSVIFNFYLTRGDTEIQTWFLDERQNTICGAYYLYIKKTK